MGNGDEKRHEDGSRTALVIPNEMLQSARTTTEVFSFRYLYCVIFAGCLISCYSAFWELLLLFRQIVILIRRINEEVSLK